MSMFQRATRQQVPLKLGITGPSGSGKTTAALNLARGLVGTQGLIAFCDTENGSASLYADITPFDVVNMNPPYQVAKFLKAIEEASGAGYNALIIDSASAEWSELLVEKEAMDARGTGNGFVNWGAITKKHEDFLKAIRNAPIHLILCLRAKQEHIQDKDEKGKTVIKKVGMAAIQRDGMEYELTTVFDLAMDHHYKVSKDRTRMFDGRMEQVTVQTGQELAAWLSSGAPMAPNTLPPVAPSPEPSTAPAAYEPSPEFVDAVEEFRRISCGAMADKTRERLIASFINDRVDVAIVLEEIDKIKSLLPGAGMAEAQPRKESPVVQSAATFVDSIDPNVDEKNGGISRDQYEALNLLVESHKINREALRAYCLKGNKLLPARVPTLARMKVEEFTKLRDALADPRKAASIVRVINATPFPYQPQSAA